MGFVDELNMTFSVSGKDRVEATMPITDKLLQPFGYVHGGATIALLESVASQGAQNGADLESELPFGVEVQVRHRKGAREGALHAVAELEESCTSSRTGSVKQTWRVTARDDAGDVVSDGVVVTKTVTRAYLAARSF